MPSSGTPRASSEAVQSLLNLDLPIEEWAKEEGIADEEMRERIRKAAPTRPMPSASRRNADEVMTYVEKQVLLQTLDHLWREHLVTLDHLRQVVGWRGYAQRDPLNEYKQEAFELFDGADRPAARAGDRAAHARRGDASSRPAPQELPPDAGPAHRPGTGEDEFRPMDSTPAAQAPASRRATPAAAADRDPTDPSTWGKVGRNEPCPCGSGKKFKHCHGQYA